jgi:trimeric autotransporter adhesin
MPFGRFAKLSLLCALLWLSAFAGAQTQNVPGDEVNGHAIHSHEVHGIVTFASLPLPGATVTATQGAKTLTAVTDQGGLYHFDDLPDGDWTLAVEMQCFETIHAQITVGGGTQPGKFDMTLLPADQLMARTRVVANPILAQPALIAPLAAKKPEGANAANAPAEMPAAPESSNEQSADGYLVNGSVNNAATSRFSTSAAFGNTRSAGKGLYTGGFALILDNSSTDARPFPISGFAAPKSSYDLITNNAYLGGPLNIPHILPRGPNFFINYA